jgi:Domain of unknown function (DUF4249)
MRRLLLVILIAPLFGCKLTEVTVAQGEPRVVVQAVLSVGAPQQIVVVERSQSGSAYGSTTQDVPPGEPRLPIGGATVILTHEGPSPCTSPVDTLRAANARSGVYMTDSAAVGTPFCSLEAGDRVGLRVETPDGTVVTGATLIPGARQVSVRLSTDSAMAVGDSLDVDRQRDTIRVAVDGILARAIQVEVRQRDDPDSLVMFLFTDSLGIALPANLVNPFEGDNKTGDPIFAVGTTYVLTVAVADSNYFDFVRSGSDPITGRGFLNHLDGGIGVFGSVAPYRYTLHVVK